MTIKKENIDEINKVQVFSTLLKEGMSGVVSYLGKVNVAQEDIRLTADKLRKNFTKEMLFNFLITDSASNKEDTSVLLRKTKDGYTLQPHILSEALDSEVQQVLNDYMRKEYQGFKAIRPEGMTSKMLRFVISQLKEKEAFGRQTKETLADVESQDKESAIERGESAGINRVLSNFKMRGSSTKYNLENAKEAINRGISMVTTYTKRELNEWKRTLEAAPTQNMRSLLEPFLQTIDSRLSKDSTEYVKGVELDADMLIGKLDLKFLSRREDIYKYWQGIDEKFEDVVNTVKEFKQGLKEIETTNDKLKEVIQDFIEIADRVESNENEYKYILEYDGKTMKDWVKGRDKVQVLFETFLDSLDRKGADVELDRQRDELIQELGLDSSVSNEELGLEGRQLATRTSMTDKETGEKREFIEMDAIRAKEENVQASRLGKKLGKLHETTKVDPLFYYVYAGENKNRNEYSAWAEWPIFSKEVKRIKQQMKILGTKFVVEIDDEIEDYVNKLGQQAVVTGMNKYYLPASERILDSGIIQTEDNDKINEMENLKNIGEFLETISKFLSSGADLDRLASPTTTSEKGTQAQEAPQMISATFGRKDRQNFLAEIKELSNEHEAMMQAIIEYYITPMTSRFKPFDDKIEFANSRLIQILTNAENIRKDNSFFTLLAMEAEFGSLLLDETELEKLVVALEFVTTPANKDFKELRKQLDGLQTLSVEILGGLGGNFKEDSKVELGAFLNNIITKNKLNDVTWKNKKTEEWKELYNPQKVYPLEGIESHLRKNQNAYSTDERYKALMKRFFSAIDDMNIVKSEEELKLLDAHDTIRKMMDKPVYYNTSKLDNYNHVNTAISILKEEYHVDVSVNDIEQIVTKIDSMENISKTHGIPVESVYYLKANFR